MNEDYAQFTPCPEKHKVSTYNNVSSNNKIMYWIQKIFHPLV